MSFKIRKWRGDEIIDEKNQAIGQSLYKGISHILNEANNIAPKDDGILIQTSGVDVDVSSGEANAYYTQKYAPRLHEHPEYNFQGGRQGKWLEQTVLTHGEQVREIMIKEIKERLGG